MPYPIVLLVESPILHPAPAKPGDFVVVHADRVEIVRQAPNNQGAWLSQWMQGNLTPASDEDASRLSELVRPSSPEPPRPKSLPLRRDEKAG